MSVRAAKASQVLIVEDRPGVMGLVLEARVAASPVECATASDAAEGLRMLRRGLGTQLILLDLDQLGGDRREMLSELKTDEQLRHIPVVVFIAPGEARDWLHLYRLQANCVLQKPFEHEELQSLVRAVDDFWLRVVKLPPPLAGAH